LRPDQHERFDHIVEGLGDDRVDLSLVPTRYEVEHLISRSCQRIFICAKEHVGELTDPEAEKVALSEEARAIERPAEGKR